MPRRRTHKDMRQIVFSLQNTIISIYVRCRLDNGVAFFFRAFGIYTQKIRGRFSGMLQFSKHIIRRIYMLLTSRFLKSRHFDPTIYTCAKNREVSVSQNFAIFWLVVRMVRSQATVHAFMHAAHAVCMRAELVTF